MTEGHGGHGRPQDVVHFGSDLIVRAGDVECCHLHHVFEDSVLHGRHRNNRHIVLGLAVRLAGELVHGQGDTRDRRARPANAAAAWLLQALVLPELLNHADGPCVDARTAAARHGSTLSAPAGIGNVSHGGTFLGTQCFGSGREVSSCQADRAVRSRWMNVSHFRPVMSLHCTQSSAPVPNLARRSFFRVRCVETMNLSCTTLLPKLPSHRRSPNPFRSPPKSRLQIRWRPPEATGLGFRGLEFRGLGV